jgi:hypothetical protein
MSGQPPKKNAAYTFYMGLPSQSNGNTFQSNPTLATGDVKVIKDGGTPANIGTLPSAVSSGKVIEVNLTSTEMNADDITLLFSDAAGDEWQDTIVNIQTSTNQIDDIASAVSTVDGVVDAIKAVTDNLPDSGALSSLAQASALSTVDNNVDAILVDTDTTIPGLISGLNDPTAAVIADAVLDEALSGHTSAGTLGKAIADIESDATAILADTNELQTDNIPGTLSTIEGKIDTIDGIVDDILVDTAEIGAAGAGLTAISWNSSWDSEVQSEVADALSAYNAVATTDLPSNFGSLSISAGGIVDGSLEQIGGVSSGVTQMSYFFRSMVAFGADSSGSNTITDSALNFGADDQIIGGQIWLRDEGEAAYITDFDEGTDTATIDHNWVSTIGGSEPCLFIPSPRFIGGAGEITGGINTNGGTLTTLDGLDTAQDSQHSTTQSAISGLNNISSADVNSACDTALADYDAPTKTEMDAAFTEIKGATFSGATDSLEAIRDRGDAEWVTGGGGSAPTVEEIRAEMDSNSTQLAAIVADTNELQTNQGNWLTADVSGLATAAALVTVDNVVDAIKVKTDQLTFTVTNQVDANAESMNGAEILGDGTSGDLWRGS